MERQAIKEMLKAERERVSERMVKDLENICHDGLRTSIKAYNFLKSTLLVLAQKNEELNALRDKIDTPEGIEEVKRYFKNDRVLGYDLDLSKNLMDELYYLDLAVTDLGYYLPQLAECSSIEFKVKHYSKLLKHNQR